METIAKFLYDFFGQFFGGLWMIISSFFKGLVKCFDFPEYIRIIGSYTSELGALSWVVAILSILVMIALFAAIILLIVLFVKRLTKARSTVHTQEDLIREVSSLNKEVMRLNLEKDKILSMKVSQIGLNPNELSELTGEELETLNKDAAEGGRFFKLTRVDEEWSDYIPPQYDNYITLPELCTAFRNFCCSKLHLYYNPKIIRLFFASLASTRMLILQGISGTGKTSLAYAFGKFVRNDSVITSVQPSWRDRTELFGYFNEFTKKYNETELLRKMYEATYNDNLYITILDEMNIARVEYYFAELLSILEMPSRAEWIVELVPNVWPDDPKHLTNGKMVLPENMWYIGTANNDDSTFAISDKVYDRAMPIDINSKGVAFEAPDTDPVMLSSKYLESLFSEAIDAHKVSEENLKKVELLDDYVIEHFRLAFGNRIVKQLRDFVPAYVGCGGTEAEGLDYVLAKKVFRKFESMNLSFIRDEIDGLCDYLDELFGEGVMYECLDYLHRLQKLV